MAEPDMIADVAAFHAKFGVPVLTKPTVPSAERVMTSSSQPLTRLKRGQARVGESMQADNYFKVRSGPVSLEFPFVTDFARDAAQAEKAARESASPDPGLGDQRVRLDTLS